MDRPLRTTKSAKSGLRFPVARIRAMLKAKSFAQRVSDTGAVFLTAVLQYLAAEILEVSLNAARTNNGSRRIQPQHIHIALKVMVSFHLCSEMQFSLAVHT
ncbi:histone H2A [Trichonephila inaurata madagascariensis]|uniref:Histone H2A n=1 Tax=Trichonephila inaurata madagascariensis TaxID=2747483 RepID=A0A8X7BV58_9ARAC|nr:histone H2A [Trichonephila inaurata madagascariensis]